MGNISPEDRIVMKALRVATYDWEKLEFTPLLWKNLWAEGGPNRTSIDL